MDAWDEDRAALLWARRLLGKNKSDLRVEDAEEQTLPFEEEPTWPTK